MSKANWKHRIGTMLHFKNQFRRVLKEIANCFDSTHEDFDQHFREEFFRITNNALLSVYADFLTKRLRKHNQIRSEFHIKSQQTESQCDTFEDEVELEVPIEEIDIKPNIEKIQMEIHTEIPMSNRNDGAADESSDSQDNDSMQSFNRNQNEEDIPSIESVDNQLDERIASDDELQTEISIKAEKFTRNDGLINHGAKKKKVGQKTHKCDVCSKEFSESHRLKMHKRIHTGEKPFKCDVCSKRFTSSGNMKQHYLIHTGEKPHECDVCFKKFRLGGNLKQHKLTHKASDKVYRCTICSRVLPTSEKLSNHMNIHIEDKMYKCDVCFKKLRKLSLLIRHMHIHSEDKPRKCDVCWKIFRNDRALKLHNRSHTDELPFECDICSTEFRRLANLKQHMALHTGNGGKCGVCSKKFQSQSRLKSHMEQHTGKKR